MNNKTYELLKVWVSQPKEFDVYKGVAVSTGVALETIEMFYDKDEALERLKDFRMEIKPDGDYVTIIEYFVSSVYDGDLEDVVEISELPDELAKRLVIEKLHENGEIWTNNSYPLAYLTDYLERLESAYDMPMDKLYAKIKSK